MRLFVCAGGTGGGVYPALAVVQRLRREVPQVETLWAGGAGGVEAELVARAGIPFRALPAAGVHGVGLRRLPGNLWQLGRGLLAARRLLREFRPDALFFTGGYVAVPVALAGRHLPTLLYVPDIEPGLALKFLARFADRIAVTAEESRAYFPSNRRVAVTGYPTRTALKEWGRTAALRFFGFTPDLPVLLVTGGSLGALSINRALVAALPALLPEMQIIHLTGQRTWPQFETAASSLPPALASRYRAYPYLHEEMGAALAVADLVLSRAGASCLGEYPQAGVPAILVPYPYAWRYQKVNAEYLTRHGAAVILPDEQLDDALPDVVLELMRDAPRRAGMRAAMQALRRPDPVGAIARLLLNLAGNEKESRT